MRAGAWGPGRRRTLLKGEGRGVHADPDLHQERRPCGHGTAAVGRRARDGVSSRPRRERRGPCGGSSARALGRRRPGHCRGWRCGALQRRGGAEGLPDRMGDGRRLVGPLVVGRDPRGLQRRLHGGYRLRAVHRTRVRAHAVGGSVWLRSHQELGRLEEPEAGREVRVLVVEERAAGASAGRLLVFARVVNAVCSQGSPSPHLAQVPCFVHSCDQNSSPAPGCREGSPSGARPRAGARARQGVACVPSDCRSPVREGQRDSSSSLRSAMAVGLYDGPGQSSGGGS